jgi:hypothetical protein
LYVAPSHLDVDPFDDGYLLEWLIDSVRLTDNNTQQMIASIQSVLDGRSLQQKTPKVRGTMLKVQRNRGGRSRRPQNPLLSHWLPQSLWHRIGRSDSTRPRQCFGLQRKRDYGW